MTQGKGGPFLTSSDVKQHWLQRVKGWNYDLRDTSHCTHRPVSQSPGHCYTEGIREAFHSYYFLFISFKSKRFPALQPPALTT